MTSLRILADDLTGALDCAAAFGTGVPVHLGRPAAGPAVPVEIVATATRDVPPGALSAALAPSLDWLRGADIAFKKVDSLLRGNTFAEVAWLARAGGFDGIAFAPAVPAQGRVTEAGRQWVVKADGSRMPAGPASIAPSLADCGPVWVPDVRSDADMDAVVAQVGRPDAGRRLWCGSAGLAHALARRLAMPASRAPSAPARGGAAMLVSASHHVVSREQWRVLRGSRWADQCHAGADPDSLRHAAAGYPRLVDLSPPGLITAEAADALLARQAALVAQHAPLPGVLVVVGGDTLLALCRALGAGGLCSAPALDRPGWGSAQLVGGRWDGLVCHTRSGAFGGPQDLLDVMDALAVVQG